MKKKKKTEKHVIAKKKKTLNESDSVLDFTMNTEHI